MPRTETACLLGLLGAPVIWFLGSLGAFLGGLEFIVPLLLSFLVLDPTDFMSLAEFCILKKVFNAYPGLFLSKMAPQKWSLSCEGLVLSL